MLGGTDIPRSNLILSAFLLLAFLPGTPHAAGEWHDDLYVWVGASVLISSAFLGLAYMASKALELPALDAWVKIELGELTMAIVIAVFCVALIASTDVAAKFLAGKGAASPDLVGIVSEDFVRQKLYADGQELYGKLGVAYFNIAKVASYSYTAGTSVAIASVSYSASPAGGLSNLASQVGQAMDGVSNFMLLAAAQYSFLIFFKSAAVIMLPIGIFLRSFSLTRKIGGVVLAGVISTSVVFPASYFVSSEVYGAYAPEMKENYISKINVPEAVNPPATQMICNPWMQQFVQSPIPFVGGELGWYLTICPLTCAVATAGYAACLNGCKKVTDTVFMITKATFPITTYATVIAPFAAKLNDPKIVTDYLDPMNDYALPAVTQYSVLSLISFLIPLIMTMTLIRSLAVAFGGEPQLYGLSKLV